MAKSKTEEKKAPAPAAAAKAAPAAKAKASAAGKKKGSGLDFERVPMAVRDACAGAVAEALAGLAKVSVEAGEASYWEGPVGEVPFGEGFLVVPVSIGEDAGAAVLARELGSAIVNLMIGEAVDAPLESFDELHRSVLAEATAGAVAALQEALAEVLPGLELTAESAVEDDLSRLEGEVVAVVSVELRSDDGVSGAIGIVLPVTAAVALMERPAVEPSAAAALPTSHFPQLKKDNQAGTGQNLGILLDVPMQMVAVLGRKGVKLRDLLQMGPGSIMELDKLAGEPLELLVNGKLIGYGEVIVLDEKFGIKVRDVVNPEDRLRSANL